MTAPISEEPKVVVRVRHVDMSDPAVRKRIKRDLEKMAESCEDLRRSTRVTAEMLRWEVD